jgi:hypothetical protein
MTTIRRHDSGAEQPKTLHRGGLFFVSTAHRVLHGEARITSPCGGSQQKILHRGGLFFVSAERLELSTNSLKGYCSAIELRARISEAGNILSCESNTGKARRIRTCGGTHD